MADTAFSGPVIVFGQSPYPGAEYNPDLAPSLFWGGAAILDPRLPFTYLPGEAQSAPDYAWAGMDNITALNVVPYTATSGAVVASANPTSATLTLVSSSSTTSGVYITPSITRSDTGVLDTNGGAGLVALDAYASVTASFANGVMTVTANSYMPIAPGMVVVSTTGTVSSGTAAGAVVGSQLTSASAVATGGQGVAGTYQTNASNLTATSGTVVLAYPNPQACAVPTNLQTPSVYLWSPQALLGRGVSVTAAAGATYTTATISSYDVYGYPMVEQITITAGSTVNGKKAHKYIKSVVLSGGTADTTHAYSVNTIDLFGLPIRSDSFGDILINSAAGSLTATTLVTAATSYVAADRSTPTATTGDVRGTYAGFTSSTGANKLIVRQSPQPYNLLSATGLFGATQYATF
jgi:hypothetical protein